MSIWAVGSRRRRWTFAWADDPTYIVSIPGDFTWKVLDWAVGEAAAGWKGGLALHQHRGGLFLPQYGSDSIWVDGLRPGQLAHHRALLLRGQGALWIASE